MRTTKVEVLDKQFYSCYDGVPSSNKDLKLLEIHQIQCIKVFKQVCRHSNLLKMVNPNCNLVK